MTKYVGAIDQGTTSTRFMVFNHSGEIVASDQKEHKQIYPKPGWVEHDPLEIWENTKLVIQNALRKSSLVFEDLAAVGITNQRETAVIWDKTTGKPLFNAIVWQDTRTDVICDLLAKTGGQDRFRKQVGLPLATYFSGPKIKWLIENVSEVKSAVKNHTAFFGNIDTWLIWNLTGGIRGGIHVTDLSNASRTMLMDLTTCKWDQGILEIFQIPPEILPEIRPSSCIYGNGQEILAGVPVSGDLGDQQAALFGQACFESGEAKNTYGTGCFMLLNTGNHPVESKHGLLTTLGYQIGDQKPVYCLEGSIAIAGALVQWLRDNLQMIEKSSDIEQLARTVEDNGGIYFVPAFSGLFAPYWRNDARGAIVGLTRYVNRGHFARAVLESTAFQTLEVLEAMEKDSGVKLSTLKVDGGMVHNELLMQFQSDLLNVPVVRPVIAETTALGSAYAAGLAVGFWNDFLELRKNWGKEREWKPDLDNNSRERIYSEWKKAVTRTFDWVKI
jgi:glycerol kinase